MSWNPVLDLVVEIKREYGARFGLDTMNFQKWLERLESKKYNDIFSCLITNQHNEFLLVRYDLIDAPQEMWENQDSIYRECRSVVIDLDKECVALASMRKFFNINETKENSVDSLREEIRNANKVEFFDKLDGSMQMARWYNGRLLMSGSMALDPSKSFRLEEGIGMLTDNHIRMMKKYYNDTFTFEYISEKDPHVVNYKNLEDGLYLLSVRCALDGYDYDFETVKAVADGYGVKCVNHEKRTFDEVLELMKVYGSDEKEGWVMRIDGRRVKIKCDDYVNMHNVLDKLASNNVIIRAVSDGIIDDVLSKVPESHKDRVMKIVDKVKNYTKVVALNYKWYYALAPKSDKKTFMTYVNEQVPKQYQAYVRNIYLGKEINPLMSQSGKYVKMSTIDWLMDNFYAEDY